MSFTFLINTLQAATINVSSIAALQTAINNANTDDEITLANGTYTNSVITINKSHITIRAFSSGKVFLNGTQEININGNGNTFSGFQFTSGNIGEGEIINIYGNNNTLSQLNFNGYLAKKYIHINGGTQYNVIENCNIENKPVDAIIGCLIQITTTPTLPGYHKIKYCSFQNFPGPGGDYGNEPIRIGLSTEMNNPSRTIVEYCYFDNVGLGDGESISLKSCENVCRYNTFTNNPKGQLVFRHGYKNVAYGNFFINNSGGIRVKEGANHYIYNNYFSTGSLSAVDLQYVAEYPLDNINIVHNTFIDCTVDLGTNGLTNVTFANNIFTKNSGSIFRNSVGNEKWLGNIYKGNLGISIPTGMINYDPKLAINSDGFYGLTATSPAINAANANYPAILDIANVDDDPTLMLDIIGLPRPANIILKDVGCEEFNAVGTAVNRPLKLADVGPKYLKPMTTTNNPLADVLELKIIKRKDTSLLNINYMLPSDTQVSFEIFNLNGQLIKSYLSNQKESVGAHSKNFDLKFLESGIYIARFSANSISKVQKIIIEHNY